MTEVFLRPVSPEDVGVFYEHQLDPDASALAAFASRAAEEHFAHWRSNVLGDETSIARTIEYEGAVAGNVVSWLDGSKRLVGYWIGKSFWGKGIATAALRAFLDEIPERPLHALVAAHNVGSIRVLEKCGFAVVRHFEGTGGAESDVEEFLMKLPEGGPKQNR